MIEADLWMEKRRRLRRLLIEAEPWDFLGWEPVKTTMVKRGKAPLGYELRHLRARNDWGSRWRPALQESDLGAPRPFLWYPRSSGPLIHQAYHLCRFEEATGLRLPALSFIVEFGGGYGGMCRLFHQLGFGGTYVIFDLPEVCALQRFFLRHLGINATTQNSAEERRTVFTISDLETFRRLVQARSSGDCAFIAAWSLGETPIELREQILPEVSHFDAFLLGYTERFSGIDNQRFFREWRSRISGCTWYDVELPHLHKREWYLFGRRGEHTR